MTEHVNDHEVLLDVRDLSITYKVYEGMLRVLRHVDFRVGSGERVGLVGEAGCGKTTLLKTIAHILPIPPARIESGDVRFKGRNVLDGSKASHRAIRRDVSMILQDPTASLNPTLTIHSFMADILKNTPHPGSRAERTQRMMEALEKVSMPSPKRVLGSYPVQLSGGMRQRVCIAMCLLKDVDLILADEPTTSLDVTIEKQILGLLNTLSIENRKSMVLVSHALGAVRTMTDRAYVMYAGNLAEEGATPCVFEHPAHPYTIGLFEATPKLSGEGVSDGIAGELPSYLDPPPGCRFIPRCPQAMPICSEEQPGRFQLDGDHSVACWGRELERVEEKGDS